jgi:hypothetical protein
MGLSGSEGAVAREELQAKMQAGMESVLHCTQELGIESAGLHSVSPSNYLKL